MVQQSRRSFLKFGACCAALAGISPKLSFASVPQKARYIVIVLRGAMDGLAAVPPIRDPSLLSLRGNLTVDEALLFNLDGFFGMHPALKTLAGLYQRKQALVFHAIHSPYRARSHFDGQDMLETGGGKVGSVSAGWLNRALAILQHGDGQKKGFVAAEQMPLLFQGDAKGISSWAPSEMDEIPSDLIAFAEKLYQGDALLEPAFADLSSLKALASGVSQPVAGRGRKSRQFAQMIGQILSQSSGPNIAVMELGGWDTHAGQGKERGRLATALAELDAVIGLLQQGLSSVWSETVISVVTEFGRTAESNGTGGTDHGMASASFLVGGKVAGGRVLADWPGLNSSDLYEGRDLYPTRDVRSVFKGVLQQHFGMGDQDLNQYVFPNSADVAPWQGVLRG